MGGVKPLAKLALAAVVVLGGAVAGGNAGADTSAQALPFMIPSGTVTTVDISPPTPVHKGFRLACPVSSQPQFLGDSTNPATACQTASNDSGTQTSQLTILIQPNTQFYQLQNAAGQPCASGTTGCFYAPSSYNQVVVDGASLEVGGYYEQVTNNGQTSYVLQATYVYSPPGASPAPANPQPMTAQDFDYSHYFAVDATVVQTGTGITGSALWSGNWGFVVAQITNYFDNTQVEAIAAAHQNPVTKDPQLAITINDGSTPDGSLTNAGLTKFYVQHSDGLYYPSTAAETIQYGAPLLAAGSYGWGPDGDWRFIASYVWRPAPTVVNGSIQFTETTNPGNIDHATGSASYSGATAGGDGTMNPGAVSFSTSWAFDSSSGLWDVTGTWSVKRFDGQATISGTLSGTYDASSGAIQATVVLSSGTGNVCGATGTGTFTGTNPPDATVVPPTPPAGTMNGSFSLTTAKPASPSC